MREAHRGPEYAWANSRRLQAALAQARAEERQLEFSGQTVSYNPVSGLWSELDRLIVEGYDGIQYGYGAWTASTSS